MFGAILLETFLGVDLHKLSLININTCQSRAMVNTNCSLAQAQAPLCRVNHVASLPFEVAGGDGDGFQSSQASAAGTAPTADSVTEGHAQSLTASLRRACLINVSYMEGRDGNETIVSKDEVRGRGDGEREGGNWWLVARALPSAPSAETWR